MFRIEIRVLHAAAAPSSPECHHLIDHLANLSALSDVLTLGWRYSLYQQPSILKGIFFNHPDKNE